MSVKIVLFGSAARGAERKKARPAQNHLHVDLNFGKRQHPEPIAYRSPFEFSRRDLRSFAAIATFDWQLRRDLLQQPSLHLLDDLSAACSALTNYPLSLLSAGRTGLHWRDTGAEAVRVAIAHHHNLA